MGLSFSVKVNGLRRLSKKLSSAEMAPRLATVPLEKAIAALIGQGIADNFEQQGPGWAPLKVQTIRRSVSKKKRKELDRLSDLDIMVHEVKARKNPEIDAFRKILMKTRLLYKAATTPNYSGANKQGIHGSNIYRVKGSKITWGVDLIYARAQNNGNKKNKIPARRFMHLTDKWKGEIYSFVIQRYKKLIREAIREAKQ